MDKNIYRSGIEAAYRRSALRVTSAFHMVSTEMAMVIAGMMPLKLVVDLERRNHNTKRGTDPSNPFQIVDNAMDNWQ